MSIPNQLLRGLSAAQPDQQNLSQPLSAPLSPSQPLSAPLRLRPSPPLSASLRRAVLSPSPPVRQPVGPRAAAPGHVARPSLPQLRPAIPDSRRRRRRRRCRHATWL